MYSTAANMYGMIPNMYNNQIALNDLTGLDLYAPTSMYADPMLSMNGSIFGMMPNPMMTNPMMPMMPGASSNMNDYYKNYEQYQDFMINNQVRQQQKWRNADLQLNSPMEGIQKQATYLHEKIMKNEQEQIVQAYNNFKESVRRLYGDNADEQQIADRASLLYAKANGGKSLVEDIREHGSDSFTQGVLQSLTFGLADGKTAEENIAELTGQPVGRGDKMKKVAGNAVGGALIGGAGAFALSGLWKAKGPVAKTLCKVPILAAIGGVVAGICAFASKD